MGSPNRTRRNRQQISDDGSDTPKKPSKNSSRRSRPSVSKSSAQAAHLSFLNTLIIENTPFKKKSVLQNKRNQKNTTETAVSSEGAPRRKRSRISRDHLERSPVVPGVEPRDGLSASRTTVSQSPGPSQSRGVDMSGGRSTPAVQRPSGASTPVSSTSSSSSAGTSTARKRRRTQKSANLMFVRKFNPASLNPSVQMSLISAPKLSASNSANNSRVAASGDSELLCETTIKRRRSYSEEDKDQYCWICHTSGSLEFCERCPRAYHLSCAVSLPISENRSGSWFCSVCLEIENRGVGELSSEKWQYVSKETHSTEVLKSALIFMVDFLSIQCWAEPFRESLDLSDDLHTTRSVKFPMDLRKLLNRVMEGQYQSTFAFAADFEWITHTWNILGTNKTKLRLLERMCHREVSLLRACPACYLRRTAALCCLPSTHSVFPAISQCDSNIYLRPNVPNTQRSLQQHPELADGLWLTLPCGVVHPLVWVSSEKTQRLWPAKLLHRLPDGSVIVYFFGNYTSQKACVEAIRLHTNGTTGVNISSSTSTTGSTSSIRSTNFSARIPQLGSERREAESYSRALEELRRHVAAVFEAFPRFKLPPMVPNHPSFDWGMIEKYYRPFNPYLSSPQSDSNTNSHHTWLSTTTTTTTSLGAEVDPLDMEVADVVEVDSPTVATASDEVFVSSPVVIDVDRTASSLLGGSSSNNYNEPVLSRYATALHGSHQSYIHHQQQHPLLTESNTTRANAAAAAAAAGITSPLNNIENHSSLPPQLAPASDDEPPVLSDQSLALGPPAFVEPDVVVDVNSSTGGSSVSTESSQQHQYPLDPAECISQVRSAFIHEMHLAMAKAFRVVEDTLVAYQSPEPHLPTECSTIGCSTADLLASKGTECQTDIIPSSSQATSTSAAFTDTTSLVEDQACRINILQREVERLDSEVRRLRLQVDLNREEIGTMAFERIAEVRKIWDAEMNAIVAEACRVCEAEANAVVEDTKKRQWCAHCGKEAYFYCCWNTSYCNSQCQDRHWPSHMATCLQSNSQTHSLAVQQQVRQQTTAFSFPVQVAAAAASNNTNNGRHPASVILTTNGTVRGGASNNATASVFVTTNGTVFRS